MSDQNNQTDVLPKRMALVFGNEDFGARAVSGETDANLIAGHLVELGFSVDGPFLDKNEEDMLAALKGFGQKLLNNDVVEDVVFFFSGHGYQLGSENYFLPAGEEIDPVQPQVPMSKVLEILGLAPDEAVKVLFLDACRTSEGLPLKGGGTLGELGNFADGLSKPQANAPAHTLFSFSASYGQLAFSGETPEEPSRFTKALAESLREPGLEIRDLLWRVKRQLIADKQKIQVPVEEGLAGIGRAFYFRAPVILPVTVEKEDNDLLVLLNGELKLTASEFRSREDEGQPRVDLPLQAGENKLLLLASNGRGFDAGQSWRLTEGWFYEATVDWPPGTQFTDGQDVSRSIFRAAENGPFKDGPHHGRVFPVADATITVDKATGRLTVAPRADLWRTGVPIWASSQTYLWHKALSDLPLEQSPKINNYLNILRLGQDLLTVFGVADRVKLPDPASIFAVVRGNRIFRRWVRSCMDDHWPARLADLETSIDDALGGVLKPFVSFDESLTQCVRDLVAASDEDLEFAPEDVRLWTAFETRDVDSIVSSENAHENLEAAVIRASERTSLLDASEGHYPPGHPILTPREREVMLGPFSSVEDIDGVPVELRAAAFLKLELVDQTARLRARVIGDLADLQRKIGALIGRIDLPKDNCAKFSADNVVARIGSAELSVEGELAALTVRGDVEVWACLENPLFGSPFKFHTLPRQDFAGLIPFRLEPNQNMDGIELRLERPSIDLRGGLGDVIEGALSIAGIDISEHVENWLRNSVAKDWLSFALPEGLQRLQPRIERASLREYAGQLLADVGVSVLLDPSRLLAGQVDAQLS